jgi:hypothetical protein
MENIPYIIDLIKKELGLTTRIEDYGYESVLLDREELDPNLLPSHFDELDVGDEVMVHTYNVADFVVYILADAHTDKWQLIGVLNAGKLVYCKVSEY